MVLFKFQCTPLYMAVKLQKIDVVKQLSHDSRVKINKLNIFINNFYEVFLKYELYFNINHFNEIAIIFLFYLIISSCFEKLCRYC